MRNSKSKRTTKKWEYLILTSNKLGERKKEKEILDITSTINASCCIGPNMSREILKSLTKIFVFFRRHFLANKRSSFKADITTII